jgi:magnesium chelatase subunit I
VPRVTDLPALAASTLGKLELEYAGTDSGTEEIFDKLLRRATKIVFDEYLSAEVLQPVTRSFEDGWKVEVGASLPASEYVEGLENITGLADVVKRLGEAGSPGRIAAAIEFVLEGLHLSNRLNKDVQGRRILYR